MPRTFPMVSDKKTEQPSQKTAIYALTRQGATLAYKLLQPLDGDLFLPSRLTTEYPGALPMKRLKDQLETNFAKYDKQVFIAATGIVIRCLAPLLQGKAQDPAVVVLDQEGRFAISLLSGHLGGANALAREVAQLTRGQAVITTATDCANLQSIDLLAQAKGLTIANIQAIKRVNMALLHDQLIQICDPLDQLGFLPTPPPGFQLKRITEVNELNPAQPAILVSWEKIQSTRHPNFNPDEHLLLHPKCLIAGLGCNRNTSKQEIVAHLKKIFDQNHLTLSSLRCLTSIQAKENEPGLLSAARSLGVEIIFFSTQKIKQIPVPNPSQTVKKHMGVKSVCEATALAAAPKGKILIPKQKTPNVTLAVVLDLEQLG